MRKLFSIKTIVSRGQMNLSSKSSPYKFQLPVASPKFVDFRTSRGVEVVERELEKSFNEETSFGNEPLERFP